MKKLLPFQIRRLSLRTRIITWSFIPSIIITIAVALLIFNAYSSVTEDLLIEQNRDSARFEASQFTLELEEYEEFLTNEARLLGALSKADLTQPSVLSSARNRFVVFDGGVVLLDNFGKVIAAEPARDDILGQDWSGQEYYAQIARSGLTVTGVFSDVIREAPEGNEVIVVAVPVIDPQNRFTGVLSGRFNIGVRSVSAFYGDIVKLNWGEGKAVYVVDSSGTVIYHTDTSEIGKVYTDRESVIRVISGDSNALRVSTPERGNLLVSYSPVPGTPWGLITEENWDTLLSSNQNYRIMLLILLIMGVIIPVVIVYFGVRQITSPIAEVSSAAREIAAGNFSHRINPSTGDELEELANQFNMMAGALEESYNTLEQKVADRTKSEHQRAEQLRIINEIGRKISSILDLDELLQAVTETLHNTLAYNSVSIYLNDPESSELVLQTNSGIPEAEHENLTAGMKSRGYAYTAAATGKSCLMNEIPADAGTSVRSGQIRSEMAVPIVIANRTFGVLDIEESRANVFDALDLFTVETLADQLAVAIQNAGLYEQAGELAALEERNRLARDLHDAVSQTLFSASLIAEVLPVLWENDPEDGRARLEEVRQLTRGALAEMRTLLLELRPTALLEAELPFLLDQLAAAISGRSRIPVEIHTEGECTLPEDVKIGFYRIAQEALNNVAKHSGATSVKVRLICTEEEVLLGISDNGEGFDVSEIAPTSLGVGIMRERAENIGAILEILSQPGRGTEILVSRIVNQKGFEE